MDRFHQWVETFHFQYRDDGHFYDVYRKWAANDRFIEVSNSQNLTYTLGHNQFSGMDTHDFREYLLSFEKPVFETQYVQNEITAVPKSVDWVTAGAVTQVKDQGQCGSCWSFSTTGALEGAYFVKYGTLPSFSEQQLVDCDVLLNSGCKGGLMDNAFSWISKNDGLCSESDYPYISANGQREKCNRTCNNQPNSKIRYWVDVEPTDDGLMNAIYKQPVAVAIESDQRDFQLYKSGIFMGKCGTALDHAVLAVGYGTDKDGDFYLIKNSWGPTWGDNGYIKLARGPQYNNGQGQCGVLLSASYPVLDIIN
jgi:C1A family cysteine protease